MGRRWHYHVHGSSIFSHDVDTLWKRGLCCKSGFRNAHAIVTTVNPSCLQLSSAIKERVTNFSEPPSKPTGIENVILKRVEHSSIWRLKLISHTQSKAQGPQLFGIWSYCNSSLLQPSSTKVKDRKWKFNRGRWFDKLIYFSSERANTTSKHFPWFTRRHLCHHMVVCTLELHCIFTSMWSLQCVAKIGPLQLVLLLPVFVDD